MSSDKTARQRVAWTRRAVLRSVAAGAAVGALGPLGHRAFAAELKGRIRQSVCLGR